MKKKVILLSLFVGSLAIPNTVFGADFQVSGKLYDQNNNPIARGVVVFTDTSGKTIDAAAADGTGFYKTSIAKGTYNLSAEGPEGSGLKSARLTNYTIASPTSLDFKLNTPVTAQAIKPSQFPFIVAMVIGAVVCILIVLGFMWWIQKKK